ERDQHPAHIHQGSAPPEGNHRADSDQRGGEEGCRPGEPDREGTRLVAAKSIEERGDVGVLPLQASKTSREEEETQEGEQGESTIIPIGPPPLSASSQRMKSAPLLA